ncbi:MAG: alkaline phosphatase family protein [Fimbriimonas sp.]
MLLTALLLAQQVDNQLMPTGQLLAPAGVVQELEGARPVDMKLSPDGRTLFVKDRDALRVLDAGSLKETAKVSSPGGASLWGLDVSADGKKVYFTNSENRLHVFSIASGAWTLQRSIDLAGPEGKGNSFPCGIRLSKDGSRALVCLSLNNTLGIVDLASGKVTSELPTGIAPYDVELTNDGATAIVSNQGGRRPTKQDRTAPSAGTETPTDERGVANTGSLTIINLDSKATREVAVGLQPSDLIILPGDRAAVVANANSDSLTWIDIREAKATRTLVVKADANLPFGSMPDGLSLSPAANRLYVALAGNNSLAVIENPAGKPTISGLIPTGWYPTAVQSFGDHVFIANNKGVGSRSKDPKQDGWNSHNHRGTVQKLTVPVTLSAMTAKVMELAFVPQILRAYERIAKSTAAPLPVPKKLGDPGAIEHVVYVIKENRTYDQVLGDVKSGDGDLKLCTFPEINSPNHHALAKQFVLLDNYYCNGVLSADGHSWATEGNVTPYLDRAFGGFNRSYTFGDDPITYSSSGFIWDRVLGAGLSFRNYGEMNYSDALPKRTYKEILDAYKQGHRTKFTNNIGVERVRRYSDLDYPGWNMEIPDQARVDEFLLEFREFEKSGHFPSFTILYLPQDHLGGPVSSRAHMADNDLAVGRLVEAISKSRFWPKMAIFINEDDPQNGYDHVDGHRSICLVVSPYARRGVTVTEFYNQTSVIRTMLHMLGLPPLNQRDASSNLMSTCFTAKPNLSPYKALAANFSLDDSDLKKDTSKEALKWFAIKNTVPIKRTGMKTEKDEDNLNRFIWHEMKGWKTPYPTQFAGPHGKGLAKRKLKHVPED